MHPGWKIQRNQLPRKRDTSIAENATVRAVPIEETFRRLTGEAAAVTATPAATGGGGSQQQPTLPPQQTPPATIDRLHKEGANTNGMYITVMLPHLPSDTDQIPPNNPAYVTSINAAYLKAMATLPQLAPNARITIKIMAGIYYENIAVASSRIDFEGWDRATIAGWVQVLPVPPAPGTVATQFTNLDFISLVSGEGSGPNPMGALWLMPNGDASPQFPAVRLRGCNFYSDAVAMRAEQRFYAEDCHFFSTDTGPNADPANAPLQIYLSGAEQGATRLESCTLHSFLRLPGADAAGPTDYIPAGFALRVKGLAEGPRNGISVTTVDQKVWPSARVVLANCGVFGAAEVRAAELKHIGGEQHAAQSLTAYALGSGYAILMGTPIFDPVNGYEGDMLAVLTFAQCSTYAQVIASAAAYDGWNGSVIDPAHPGNCYISISECSHYVRLVSPSPFVGTGGNGHADISNSGTGAGTWAGAIDTSTFGACPFDVKALQYDPYLL